MSEEEEGVGEIGNEVARRHAGGMDGGWGEYMHS